MGTDPARGVVIVVFDGFQLLDLAGPADVFRAATLLGAEPGYRVVLASLTGEAARADCGISVAVDTSLAAAAERGGIDTLLVVGGLGTLGFADDPALVADLRRASGAARRTTSVCTGAMLLAGAGLLDGYRATTHWASSERLREKHPCVDVDADAIYVHDRDRWTSAGVTAGTDLALALVADDAGAELAHAVASWLVVFLRRPGGQSQFSAYMRTPPARTPALEELQRWMPDHLAEDLSVDALAARAGMSPRHLARTCRRDLGVTPAVLVESLRVEAAKALLQNTEMPVAAIAERVGFGRVETLHRAFQRRAQTTPARYRQHFHTLSSA